MPEESSLSPEAQDEQPAKKSATKTANKARKKPAAKKPAKVAGENEPAKLEAGSDSKSTEIKASTKQAQRGRARGRGRQDKPDGPKVELDRNIIAKRAWKIFLGEVGEEGLSLIADKEARELARRSFKVAEIYTREEAAETGKHGGKASN